MQVFTLAVLPAHPAQMPFLTNNATLQGGEDRLHQNGPRVLPTPNGQGGQVRFIVGLHFCRSPVAPTLGMTFFNSTAVAATIVAAAATTSGGTAAAGRLPTKRSGSIIGKIGNM